ncbi:MAG: hypothetical protein Q4D74_03985 [Comamonadaceae bacterium]|nr:hypothetical protein [Comamonadaceae bacterium]
MLGPTRPSDPRPLLLRSARWRMAWAWLLCAALGALLAWAVAPAA